MGTQMTSNSYFSSMQVLNSSCIAWTQILPSSDHILLLLKAIITLAKSSLAKMKKIVVGGSKEGVVHVFDTKTGAPIDVLHHTPKMRVLAVAVSVLINIT